MPDEVRVGVIGVGSMGRHHARNYAEIDGVRLVAVADPNPDAVRVAEGFEAAHYADYRQMIAEERLDALSVAAPTHLHLEIAVAAVQGGIHVLVEKPIASDEDEADALIAEARQAGVILTVGHIERFNPAVRALKGIIDAGAIGEVSSLVSQRVGGFPQYQPPTDVVLDLAIHDIDVMNLLLGKTPHLLAAHGSRTFHPDEVDSVEILLEYGSAGGFIQANWVTPIKIRSLAATGSRGYAEINYITQEITTYHHVAVLQQDSFSDFVSALGRPEKTVRQGAIVEPLRLQLESFTSAVRTGDVSELMRPEDARDVLRISREASRSLKGQAAPDDRATGAP